jgi:hypothetical protein
MRKQGLLSFPEQRAKDGVIGGPEAPVWRVY